MMASLIWQFLSPRKLHLSKTEDKIDKPSSSDIVISYSSQIFQDNDGKISFEEFCRVVGSTDIHTKMVVEV